MRGILGAGFSVLNTFGITPAHAGNTPEISHEAAADQDHPRACGEYDEWLYTGGCEEGSRGITPAHAGNTIPKQEITGRRMGSPPRMRGIPRCANGMVLLKGITPAHAGNTCVLSPIQISP